MTAEELLRQVRARGVTFQVLEENRLKVLASSPLPDGMMEELRQHKPDILALLAGEAAGHSGEPGGGVRPLLDLRPGSGGS